MALSFDGKTLKCRQGVKCELHGKRAGKRYLFDRREKWNMVTPCRELNFKTSKEETDHFLL